MDMRSQTLEPRGELIQQIDIRKVALGDVDEVTAAPLPPLRKVPLTALTRLSVSYAEHPAAA